MERIKNRVTWRQWLVFIIVGLAGQFAWSIENMYLNSYLYALSMAAPSGQGFDGSSMVAITTALSAVTATLTTIFMGSLTDKLRKRKIFICIGYVLWGLSTAAFGLLDVANADAIVPIAMSFVTAAILVIVIDCVMTFFGSTANDAAFNAYVTKNVQDKDRGKVEGVLSILPLVAMLIIFVALNGLTANGQWDLFFYIVGGLVLAVGILSFFLIPKEKKEEKQDGESSQEKTGKGAMPEASNPMPSTLPRTLPRSLPGASCAAAGKPSIVYIVRGAVSLDWALTHLAARARDLGKGEDAARLDHLARLAAGDDALPRTARVMVDADANPYANPYMNAAGTAATDMKEAR